MSIEGTREAPLSEIQQGAMRKLVEGFKRQDYSGQLHRQIVKSLTTNIVNAKDPMVRAEGVTLLGLYANGLGHGWCCRPELQAEILDTLASVGEKETVMEVKEATLEQLAIRLEQPNPGGRIHGQAVQGIRRMALSVTVTKKDSPEADFISHALDRLSAFVNRKGNERSYRPEIQSQAISEMDYITATAGVASLEDLKP